MRQVCCERKKCCGEREVVSSDREFVSFREGREREKRKQRVKRDRESVWCVSERGRFERWFRERGRFERWFPERVMPSREGGGLERGRGRAVVRSGDAQSWRYALKEERGISWSVLDNLCHFYLVTML